MTGKPAQHKSPLAAPWPPGVMVRVVRHKDGRRYAQLRPDGDTKIALIAMG